MSSDALLDELSVRACQAGERTRDSELTLKSNQGPLSGWVSRTGIITTIHFGIGGAKGDFGWRSEGSPGTKCQDRFPVCIPSETISLSGTFVVPRRATSRALALWVHARQAVDRHSSDDLFATGGRYRVAILQSSSWKLLSTWGW
jgi:hypothetical protein